MLLTGIIISSFFYIGSIFYFRYAQINNIKFGKIFLISILLGFISYIIKIPICYYYGSEYSIFYMNILFAVTCFIFVTIYSYFILDEKIERHTYIIIVIIFFLLIIDNILKKNNNIL